MDPTSGSTAEVTPRPADLPVYGYQRAVYAVLVVVAMLVGGTARAQVTLNEAAATALREAQAAASQAVATYERHYPDQPLWRDAIAAGERAKTLAPGRTEPLRFLAQAYGLTGWTARTWEAWQEYMAAGGSLDARSRADAARSALVLGYQAYNVGALDRAAELLRASYELNSDDISVVTYLGETELALGNPATAVPLLEIAVETYPQLQPNLARARLGAEYGLAAADAFIAGERAFSQGNPGAALSLYTAAMQSSTGFVEAMKGAAASNGALGRTAQSRALWEQVAQIAPQDVEVQQALALFRAADNAAAEAEAAAEAAAAAQAQAEQEAAEAAAEAAAAAAAQAQQAPAANLVPPPQQPVTPPVVAQPETPPVAEPPVAEPPLAEPPIAEPPIAEPPVSEPPVAETPVAEPPVVEQPEVPAAGPTLALLDTTLTPAAPEAGGEGAFTFMPAPAAAVGNLDSPYDYGRGTLYVQVEVLERPTDDPVFMQLCLVPDDLITVSPACSEASRISLPSSGVVNASQSVSGLEGAAGVDWSQGMAQLIVVLRDTDGRPLDSRYALDIDGRPLEVSAFYPMSLRVRAVLVPQGSSFDGW